MNFQRIIGWMVFAVLLLLTACDPEPPKQEENLAEQILGHWEVFEAIRNEKPTTTLEDAYFDFEPDGNAILNLMGADQKAKYEMVEEVIKITGTQMDGDYKIENLGGDTLVLSTSQKFNEIPFRFIFNMKKVEKTIIPEEEI